MTDTVAAFAAFADMPIGLAWHGAVDIARQYWV
jgi:hypothetical protein